MTCFTIEAEVRYLPGKEGKRATVVKDGCQALFWSEEDPEPWDCTQGFPELPEAKSPPLGKRLRTRLQLYRKNRGEFPALPITRGTAFAIQQNACVIGYGVITSVLTGEGVAVPEE